VRKRNGSNVRADDDEREGTDEGDFKRPNGRLKSGEDATELITIEGPPNVYDRGPIRARVCTPLKRKKALTDGVVDNRNQALAVGHTIR